MKRSCDQCSGRMPVTARRDSRFCSGACRQKAYRARSRPLPKEMTGRARWVRHDARKRPMTATGGPASVTDPSTWSTYAEAARSPYGVGLGIVLGDGIGCIDLDHCISDGVVAPWAQAIVEEWRDRAVLVEVSLSGSGAHIFAPMPEAPGRRVRDGERSIETYSRARYIAVTGVRL